MVIFNYILNEWSIYFAAWKDFSFLFHYQSKFSIGFNLILDTTGKEKIIRLSATNFLSSLKEKKFLFSGCGVIT